MATKTIRLSEDQEEQLQNCQLLIKTDSAQATFSKLLITAPQWHQRIKELENDMKELKAELLEAKHIVQALYQTDKRIKDFMQRN